jgi:phosphatidylinositol-3-phosphatase
MTNALRSILLLGAIATVALGCHGTSSMIGEGGTAGGSSADARGIASGTGGVAGDRGGANGGSNGQSGAAGAVGSAGGTAGSEGVDGGRAGAIGGTAGTGGSGGEGGKGGALGGAGTGGGSGAGESSGGHGGSGGPVGGASGSGAGTTGTDAGASEGGVKGSKFDHLVVILMENHNIGEIYGKAPYMTNLADQNVLLQAYTAVDHPSEPNYLAIASGQTFNPPSGDDKYHVFKAKNVVDSLEAVGLTWKAYSESAAGPCDTANPDVRHVPFLFFSDVATAATRCDRVIPTTPNTDVEMIAELNSTSASNFIWLTPNDNNNMHTGTIARGDMYLQNLVPQILGSRTFMTTRAALFIVYDEGNLPFPNDLIYALWAGPVVKKTTKLTTAYTHYSLLATLEVNWGFSALTMNDAAAPSMMAVFQ